jgi:hypothetical protein
MRHSSVQLTVLFLSLLFAFFHCTAVGTVLRHALGTDPSVQEELAFV